ncbi:MAG: glycosyltransferase, partial [Anaerolineales bacterium]|nr:glycosyltransferase [Anaerolineales bacterium]
MTEGAEGSAVLGGPLPVRLVHIISGLELGGAETMLYQLLAGTDLERFPSEVVSMTTRGLVGERIAQLGVPVHALGMRRGLPTPWHLLPLVRLLRRARPDLIQTWMYHADLFGGVAARLGGRIPVVWGIHHTRLERESTPAGTLWTARVNARLSHRLPARIVCCSEATRRVHVQMGYAADKMVVIPNGVDLERFGPNPEARPSVRAELGLAPDALLIGMAARFHPLKDHARFVQAARRIADLPGVHFLLCGEGIVAENSVLSGWIEQAGLSGRFHLLGRRVDMPRLFASLDLSTLPSRSEAFPLVVGEAMASGVPCVVTDVGDSAEIVGTTGLVVPPGDPEALAAAWRDLIEGGPELRGRLGELARQRVEERYSLQASVS